MKAECLCYHAIKDFDGIHHDLKCPEIEVAKHRAESLHDEIHDVAALVNAHSGVEIGWAPEEAIPIIAYALYAFAAEKDSALREANEHRGQEAIAHEKTRQSLRETERLYAALQAEVAGLREALRKLKFMLPQLGSVTQLTQIYEDLQDVINAALASPSAAWERSKLTLAAEQLEEAAQDSIQLKRRTLREQERTIVAEWLRERAAALRAQGE